MALSDELRQLDELRQRGVLSDDEFARAKARVMGEPASGGPLGSTSAGAWINQLRRSRKDRWVSGVCGGLSVATGLDTWVWRLGLAALAFAGGFGVLIYILLWVFVPSEA